MVAHDPSIYAVWFSSTVNILVASKFLISNKILNLVGSKNSDMFEVVAYVFLIKMKYILENCLFSADIHHKSDAYLFYK